MGVISVTLVKATVKEVNNLFETDTNGTIKNVFITPTLFPTKKPHPTLLPTFKFKPIPTIDPDPIVTCFTNINCGGDRRVKKSECNKTCCSIEDNKWELVSSKEECNTRRDEYYKKLIEEDQKKFDSYIINIPTSLPTLTTDNESVQRELNLRNCLAQATKNFGLPPVGSMIETTDSNAVGLAVEQKTYGEIVGDSRQANVSLDQARARCRRLYGQ